MGSLSLNGRLKSVDGYAESVQVRSVGGGGGGGNQQNL